MKDWDINEFDQILSALGVEIQSANVYFTLYRDVRASFSEYSREVRESQCFWGLASEGMKEAALIRLCRVFDDDRTSVNLRFILRTIVSNPGYFDEAAFRSRLGSKIEEFGISHRAIDDKQLNRDIDYINRRKTPVVNKLLLWRGSRFAHSNVKLAVREAKGVKDGVPTLEEVSELLKEGLDLLNRYTRYFRLQSYTSQAIGHDDYKFVLQSVRRDLDARQKEYEEQCREFGFDPYTMNSIQTTDQS